MTTETAALTPFFERGKGSLKGLPADSYEAGLRGLVGGEASVRVTLPAQMVEKAVLSGAQLSIWLSAADGRLILDGLGLDEDTLESVLAAGPLREQTLLGLVEASIASDHLAMEDDPIADLIALKCQLIEALAKVEGALARLKRD